MESPTIESGSSSNKPIKIILGILGTILLGAIGSGVWERIGDPLMNFCTSAIINGINLIFSTYKDSIYMQSSYGFREDSANALFTIFMGILGGIYFNFLTLHPWIRTRYSKEDNRQNRTAQFFKSGSGFILIGIFVFTFLSFSLILSVRISSINNIITYTQTNIDRLAPMLTEQEEEELLAEFRSVKNAEDYYKFHSKLLKLSSDHHITLRKIRLL